MAAPDYATEIAQLQAAVSSGELTIESNGERVTYRSMDDLMRALSYYESKAAEAATSAAGRSRSTLASYEGF